MHEQPQQPQPAAALMGLGDALPLTIILHDAIFNPHSPLVQVVFVTQLFREERKEGREIKEGGGEMDRRGGGGRGERGARRE